jgi:hypothetical protein
VLSGILRQSYRGYLVVGVDGKTILRSRSASQSVPEALLQEASQPPGFSGLYTPSRSGEDLIYVAAAVRTVPGETAGYVVLEIDPEAQFHPILHQARVGESGETYAFSRSGLMLSESLFEHQLRDLKLIGEDESSAFRIEIRDPGGNLVNGYVPALTRSDQPLTHMLQEAVVNGRGRNLVGYNDYRGVPVVGAWIWNGDDGAGRRGSLPVAAGVPALEHRWRDPAVCSDHRGGGRDRSGTSPDDSGKRGACAGRGTVSASP